MIILQILIIVILLGIIGYVHIKTKPILPKKHEEHISFENIFKQTELPMIDLSNNDKEFTFVLDSGSTYSVINEKVLDKLKYEEIDTKGTMYGIDGKTQSVRYVKIVFTYKGNKYADIFQVLDVPAFDNMSKSHNITISGLLGDSFFVRYKGIIDFEKFNIKLKQ